MSLLRRGQEVLKLFPEILTTDSDGNTITRASSVGVVVRGSVQPINSTENADGGGFNTETRYRVRLVGGWPIDPEKVGAQAKVEWRDRMYSVEGDPLVYSGSSRTAHTTFTMTRS